MGECPLAASFVLLVELAHGPGFGLDLIQRVAERTGDLIRMHQGSVYPALRKLARAGLAYPCSGPQMPPTHGGRARRYYAITAAGRVELAEQRRAVLALFGIEDESSPPAVRPEEPPASEPVQMDLNLSEKDATP